ncbi:hypothetical protein ACP70R_004008 [Stipagrostis hirtigluma subsp. patula]
MADRSSPPQGEDPPAAAAPPMDVEATATQLPSGSSAAAYPRWVLLEHFCRSNADDDAPSLTDDLSTLASARTTGGHPILVSLRLTAPPASSCVLVQLPGCVAEKYSIAAAAHGDSVLIQVVLEERYNECTADHFVYNAGAAAADPPLPPSLSLLPPHFLTEEEKDRLVLPPPTAPMQRQLNTSATGILRRGEDELVVAELEMAPVAKLLILRSGEWSVKRPPVSRVGGDCWDVPSSWSTDTVVPVLGRLLCWVDLLRGIVFSDVFEENPGLRFVPLPKDPCFERAFYRNVCATAGGATVKFVNIFPRCCCGEAGTSFCRRSSHAYVVHAWTLKMDDMTWVMDGMIDATELWALDEYKGLPRVELAYPVVSMDEPHAICFLLCEDFHVGHGDDTLWQIMVDMRSKTLRSVSRYPGGRWNVARETLIPCRVSYYFNPCPSGSSDGTMAGKGQVDIEPPPVALVDDELLTRNDGSNSTLKSCCKVSGEPAVKASAILAAFKEVPSYGLASDDMVKAYSILSNDNGRRIKSLLRLPMNLRKDWLLMEIKCSEA